MVRRTGRRSLRIARHRTAAPEERLEWTEATVPGTVFASYVDAGKEKDPNFGDNIHQVDRSKYDREYWYRTEFEVPAELDKELLWLNFRGINRKGTIFLNGTRLGELDGFMHRGRFDVTKIVRRSGKNTLAVLVDIPRGSLGNNASPTYICSAGWDWMPYVPGLNSGITDKVYLSTSNALTLADPWIRSELPSTARADVSIRLGVRNDSEQYASGEVSGVIMPRAISGSRPVSTSMPGRTAEVRFDQKRMPGALDRRSAPVVAQRLRRTQPLHLRPDRRDRRQTLRHAADNLRI